VSNSIKFTRPNGTIEVAVKNYKNRFEIVVKDDGIGIPEGLQPFIFEKETRAARLGLNGEPSNGIGLYVVRKLTGLLDGQISFESKENKGTKFTVEFPKH
jgi:two-component system sensor histidine kinase VicK